MNLTVKEYDMSKIVYLFGAGASANALPIVSQMPDRIRKMIDELPSLENKEEFIFPSGDNTIKGLQGELSWLYDSIGNHATIDTLAKKIWLKGNGFSDEYYRFKFATAAYFTLEQVYNQPDQRYDTFWASLLNTGVPDKLPNNITILSWNYDSQFEITFREYNFNHIPANQIDLGMTDSGDVGDRFNILKLNGAALLMTQSPSSEKYMTIDPFSQGEIGKSILNYIHNLYVNGQKAKHIYCPLSFAWAYTAGIYPQSLPE